MKILVVDDDPMTAQALRAVLTHQNYVVEVASDGVEGWELIEAYDYDLVLLDVLLPRLDGVSLCRQIRKKGLKMPILLLTGLNSGADKASGLDAGADDYVVKPFEETELVARVRALLRRSGSISNPIMQWRDLKLDPSVCEVTYGGKRLSLTPKEYGLLELFLRNSRRVFSCGMILEHLWAYEEMPGEEAVRTHIKGLRQKLKAVGAPTDLIETVYGIGYRLNSVPDLDAAAQTKQTKRQKFADTPTTQQDLKKQQASALIQEVWHEFKDSVYEKVAVLAKVKQQIVDHNFNETLKQTARQSAHTLAGSLGIFGLQKGSMIARQLEQTLLPEQSLNLEQALQFEGLVQTLQHEIEHPPSGSTDPCFELEFEKDARPLLLVVDGDSERVQQVIQSAPQWGYQAKLASSLYTAQSLIEQQLPDVVLLDPCISAQSEDGVVFLAELSKRVPPIPTILYSSQECLLEQPEFCHLGGQVCLSKALPTTEVFVAIADLLVQVERSQSKVVAVDDDPMILATLRSTLTPWGVKVITLEDAHRTFETLAQFSPDLLVLDVEMPSGSGIDLCQQIRSWPEWYDLPILFLTAHASVEVINQIFEAGADDFISKPIAGPELVTRIIPRLERIRLAKRMLGQNRPEHSALQLRTFSPTTMTIERHLTRQIQQQSAIAQWGLAVLKGTDLTTLIPNIMATILQLLEVDFDCLLEPLQEGQAFLVRDGMGWNKGIVGSMLISDQSSQGHYTLTANQPVASEHLATEVRFKVPQCFIDAGATSSLSVPIKIGEESEGVLAVYTHQQHTFAQDEIEFLEAIAQIIAGAKQQHQNQDLLQKLRWDMEQHIAEQVAQRR